MVLTSRLCLFALAVSAFACGGCAAQRAYASAHLIGVTADPGVRVQRVRYGRCVGSGRACVFVAQQSCTELPCELVSEPGATSIEIRGDDGESRHGIDARPEDLQIRIHRSIPNRLVPLFVGLGLGSVPLGFVVGAIGIASDGDLARPTLASGVTVTGIGLMGAGVAAWITSAVLMGWNDHGRISVGPYRAFGVIAPVRDGTVFAIGARF